MKKKRKGQRLNYVLVSQSVAFACQPCTRSSQATTELPSSKLAVDKWMRANGEASPRQLSGFAKVSPRPDLGSWISHPCDCGCMGLDPGEKQQSCRGHLGKAGLLVLHSFSVLQATGKCSFVFVIFSNTVYILQYMLDLQSIPVHIWHTLQLHPCQLQGAPPSPMQIRPWAGFHWSSAAGGCVLDDQFTLWLRTSWWIRGWIGRGEWIAGRDKAKANQSQEGCACVCIVKN